MVEAVIHPSSKYPLFDQVIMESVLSTKDVEKITQALETIERIYPELHEEEGVDHEFIFDPQAIIDAKLDVDTWLALLNYIAHGDEEVPAPDKTEPRPDITPEEWPLLPPIFEGDESKDAAVRD